MGIRLGKDTEQRLPITVRQCALDEVDPQLGEVRSRNVLDFIVHCQHP